MEDGARARTVPGTARVRDQRGRADTQHLRAGEDDERQVAGDADGSNRFLAEAADPVEIDQEYSVCDSIVTSMKLAVRRRWRGSEPVVRSSMTADCMRLPVRA